MLIENKKSTCYIYNADEEIRQRSAEDGGSGEVKRVASVVKQYLWGNKLASYVYIDFWFLLFFFFRIFVERWRLHCRMKNDAISWKMRFYFLFFIMILWYFKKCFLSFPLNIKSFPSFVIITSLVLFPIYLLIFAMEKIIAIFK